MVVGKPRLSRDCRLNLKISGQFNLDNKDKKFGLTSVQFLSKEVMTLQLAENSTTNKKQLTGGAIRGPMSPQLRGLI